MKQLRHTTLIEREENQMSTQVLNQNNELVMQRNATRFGSLVTVFCSCDAFFNSGQDSVEQQMVEVEDGRTMRAWEALNELSSNGKVAVTFKWA